MGIDKALELLGRGWALFPCVCMEKRPATRHGFLDASKDESQIIKWFGTGDKNIGVRTGTESGIVVVDDDKYKGTNMIELILLLGELPPTYAVKTRAGGYHFYYKYPKGRDLRSYNGKLAPHVDLKANGGYVIAEGSCVAADKNGPSGYHKVVNDIAIAELPDRWVNKWESLNVK